MHPELVDIPLMIKPSGGINGPKRISKTYVYHHDITATILGLVAKDLPQQFEGIDLSLFFDNRDQLLQNRDYITCGFDMFTLYKDDNFALITSNDKKVQKLYDLNTDPSWNENIASDHPDICEDLFNKIEKDANGKLHLVSEKSKELYKSWYVSDMKNK